MDWTGPAQEDCLVPGRFGLAGVCSVDSSKPIVVCPALAEQTCTFAIDVQATVEATPNDVGLFNYVGDGRFSHYRILRKIGGGGMGVVYNAEDLKLGHGRRTSGPSR